MIAEELIDEESIGRYEEYKKARKKVRAKQMKRYFKGLLLSVLIGFVVGLVGSLALMSKGEESGGDGSGLLLLAVLWFLICFFLHIFIHEFGHYVFGKASGYEFQSFRMFSFLITKRDGKTYLRHQKVVGILGQCLMKPPALDAAGEFPYRLYNYGGGLLNLILSAVVTPFIFFTGEITAWGAGIFAVTGLLIGLSNLIPMDMGLPNDGKNVLLCNRSAANRRAVYLQLKFYTEMSAGKELVDYEKEDFWLPEDADISNILTGLIKTYEYRHYYAKGDYEKSDEILASLEQCESKMSLAMMNSVDLERFYLLVLRGASLEEMAAYYSILGPALKMNKADMGVLQIKYAYALLVSAEDREQIEWLSRVKNGRLPKKLGKYKPFVAEEIYKKIVKVAKNYSVPGVATLAMKEIEQLRAKAENTPQGV